MLNMLGAFGVSVISITGVMFVSLRIHFYNEERKKWNNGICPDCNEPWEFVGYDLKSGYRVYICDKHVCAISFKSLDKRK